MTPDADFRGSVPTFLSTAKEPWSGDSPGLTKWQDRHGASGDVPGEPLPVQVRLRPAGQAGRRSLGKLARAVAAPEPRSPASWFAALGTTSCRSRKLKQSTDTVSRLKTAAGPARALRGAPAEWGPDDWKWLRVTRGRWGQQSARRQPSGRQCADRAGPGRGDQQSPQNFAAQGPRPYLQRRRRPRGRGPGALDEGRPRPGGGLGRVRGSGSVSAPVRLGLRLPRRGCSQRRRGARAPPCPRPRRLAAAGAEAAAARPPAAGAATPAPGEEPRAHSPAHRPRGPWRSRPAAVGGPAPTRALPLPACPQLPAWARSVRPVPTGSLRLERKRAPQGHLDRRPWGQNWNPKESQGTTLLRTPPSPWLSYPSAFQGARSHVGLWGCR